MSFDVRLLMGFLSIVTALALATVVLVVFFTIFDEDAVSCVLIFFFTIFYVDFKVLIVVDVCGFRLV